MTRGSGRRSESLTRKVARAGGWKLAKRLVKPIPVVGTAFAVGMAAHEIRKKGLKNGALHVGLDVTPVVGTVKALVEIFTGDLLPDKEPADRHKKLPGR